MIYIIYHEKNIRTYGDGIAVMHGTSVNGKGQYSQRIHNRLHLHRPQGQGLPQVQGLQRSEELFRRHQGRFPGAGEEKQEGVPDMLQVTKTPEKCPEFFKKPS